MKYIILAILLTGCSATSPSSSVKKYQRKYPVRNFSVIAPHCPLLSSPTSFNHGTLPPMDEKHFKEFDAAPAFPKQN